MKFNKLHSADNEYQQNNMNISQQQLQTPEIRSRMNSTDRKSSFNSFNSSNNNNMTLFDKFSPLKRNKSSLMFNSNFNENENNSVTVNNRAVIAPSEQSTSQRISSVVSRLSVKIAAAARDMGTLSSTAIELSRAHISASVSSSSSVAVGFAKEAERSVNQSEQHGKCCFCGCRNKENMHDKSE